MRAIRTPYESCDPGTERWQELANCAGKAFELFEYQERNSPLCREMNFEQRLDFNRANFELASEICIECPVMLTCLSEATAEERRWTVRGGEYPHRFTAELQVAQNLEAGRGDGSDFICQRGHFVAGGGRCRTCKRERQNEWQQALRARKRAEKLADGVS